MIVGTLIKSDLSVALQEPWLDFYWLTVKLKVLISDEEQNRICQAFGLC